jgi:hypothetical protein
MVGQGTSSTRAAKASKLEKKTDQKAGPPANGNTISPPGISLTYDFQNRMITKGSGTD